MTSDPHEKALLMGEARAIERNAGSQRRDFTPREAARLIELSVEINRIEADAEAAEGWGAK